MCKKIGKVYLIPNLLGDSSLEVLPAQVENVVRQLTYFVVENEKSARKFIKRITPDKVQASLQIAVIDKHNHTTDLQEMILVSYLKPVALVLLTQGLKL